MLSRPARLVPDERGLRESDRDWLLGQAEDDREHSFVLTVASDLSSAAHVLGEAPACEVLKMAVPPAVPSRGSYASLVKGFWLVRDRLRQVHLKQDMQVCVAKIEEKCTAKSAEVGSDRVMWDVQDLPPIKDADHMSFAISHLENLSTQPAGPLGSTTITGLRICAKASAVIREVLRSNVPGRAAVYLYRYSVYIHNHIYSYNNIYMCRCPQVCQCAI